jgi:hypothetical protein
VTLPKILTRVTRLRKDEAHESAHQRAGIAGPILAFATSPTCSPASPTNPVRRITELLPWNWQPLDATRAAA